MSEAKTMSIKEQNKGSATSLMKKNIRKFLRNKLAVFGLVVVALMTIACVVAFIGGIDFRTPDMMNMRAAPNSVHMFGTDTIGRDLLARVLVGGCYSIFIGVFCAVASIVFVARIDSITSNAGTNYETNALAAAIIGGVTFDGGKGTIGGAFLGCLLMGVISNAMNILGVDTNVQTIITGVIIVGAVVLSNINNIKKK